MATNTPHLALLPSSFKTSARRYAADRGVLTVPERRGASRTRLVRLPILRIHSPHPNPGAPIVVLGGGPGLTNMKARPPDRLLASHDVVIVGYRGVDGSVKLDAPEVRRAMRGVGKDLLGPASRANFGRAIRQSAARMAEEGIDLGGYTIPEVVEDLEDARMALGYEHVNLLSGVDPVWWTPKMRALPSRWESDATPQTVLPAGVQG